MKHLLPAVAVFALLILTSCTTVNEEGLDDGFEGLIGKTLGRDLDIAFPLWVSEAEKLSKLKVEAFIRCNDQPAEVYNIVSERYPSRFGPSYIAGDFKCRKTPSVAPSRPTTSAAQSPSKPSSPTAQSQVGFNSSDQYKGDVSEEEQRNRLCNLSTTVHLSWAEGAVYRDEVAEAKKLGLGPDCRKELSLHYIDKQPGDIRPEKKLPSRVSDAPSYETEKKSSDPDGHRQYDPELIASLQTGLSALGYDAGSVDGAYGPKTRNAIFQFQRDASLPETGIPTEELAFSVAAIVVARRKEQSVAGTAGKEAVPQTISTGTGFVVSPDGVVVTNHHVVEGCDRIIVHRRGRSLGEARFITTDSTNDLALMQTNDRANEYASFRQGRGVRPGDEVVVVGFPLQGLLTTDPTVTTGNISALAGIGNDRRFIQITAPVQKGNSGGPTFDASGNIVGVVVGKLDAIGVATATGDIPQNVNFAINASLLRTLMDSSGVDYQLKSSVEDIGAAEIAAQATKFTVMVECQAH